MFGIKQTDSKSSTWMMFNTDRNKPLCNEKSIGRCGCSYKQRYKPDTDNKQLQKNEYKMHIYAYE
jgi:hypothetical protein